MLKASITYHELVWIRMSFKKISNFWSRVFAFKVTTFYLIGILNEATQNNHSIKRCKSTKRINRKNDMDVWQMEKKLWYKY